MGISVTAWSEDVLHSYDVGSGIWVLKAPGRVLYTMSTVAFSEPRNVVHVEADTDGFDHYEHGAQGGQVIDSAFFQHAAAPFLPAGDYFVVSALAATNVARVRYEVSTEPGAYVTAEANASRVDIFREWAFRGTVVVSEERNVNDRFNGGLPVQFEESHTARAVANATLAYASPNRLFGAMIAAGQVADTSVQGAQWNGLMRSSPSCWAMVDAPPGDYLFRIGHYVAAGRETGQRHTLTCGGGDPAGAAADFDALVVFAADVAFP